MPQINNFMPGRYRNKNNKLVILTAYDDMSYLVDEKSGYFYNDKGHCFYWSEPQKKLILYTDPVFDLIIN